MATPTELTRLDMAAAWLAARPEHQAPRPIIPELRKLFDLTALEACQAIRQANELRHDQTSFDRAVEWLAGQPGTEPVMMVETFGTVHRQFGLSAAEAGEAIEIANERRAA